ncbi:MAG: T9SS type A sorting domain-containing protein [Bacteroidales bacterium]|nr:T9SS type A sorting domain-containing protein [Bacteroidales bacterium]MCF8457977.1 T9SS type A sorting domain-containing protein [Bacteroidales bacterium]
MKTILAFLLFSILGLIGMAQPHTFMETIQSKATASLLGNLWSIAEHDNSFSPEHPDSTSITYFIRIGQDSTINSFLYQKVEKSYDTLLTTWSLNGFIRYDTTGDIYYRGLDEIEFLLYSFSLEKFDTLALYGYGVIPQLSAYVYDEDSILLGNIYRKQFFIEYLESGFQEIWVEGIGSLSSPLRHITDHTIGNYITREILCLHNDNDQVYQNPGYSSCQYFYPTPDFIEPIKAFQSLKIYPNPAYSQLNIDFDMKINKLEVYNQTGQIVKIINSNQSQEIIDISDLINGNYFIRIICQKEVYLRKFAVVR